MIVLNLQCSDAHPFEGWFDSVEDFDRQADSALIACPLCGDTHVARLPSGPRVKKSADSSDVGQQMMKQMINALSEAARGSEDVADRFPEEARRMHYGETATRNIRGKASVEETRELLEEGIPVMPLPFPVKEEFH